METWVAVILTGITSGLGTYIAFRIRFERFQSKDIQREEDWKLWRAQLEERITRMDTREQAHERECNERWQKLMSDHGGILADIRRLMREER